MPWASRRQCAEYGCRELTTNGRCEKHRRERPSSTARGYDRRYRNKRAKFLEHLLCQASEGCSLPATQVHHTERLVDGADPLDVSKWQGLCDGHHEALGGQGGWV